MVLVIFFESRIDAQNLDKTLPIPYFAKGKNTNRKQIKFFQLQKAREQCARAAIAETGQSLSVLPARTPRKAIVWKPISRARYRYVLVEKKRFPARKNTAIRDLKNSLYFSN